MNISVTHVLSLLLLFGHSALGDASEWNVRDLTADSNSPGAALKLVVSKTGIQLVRAGQESPLVTINPKDVVALWYDDKYVDTSLGREWWIRIDEACHLLCADNDLTTPLVLLALGGAGYLAAEPFSKRQHVVNIRYRTGARTEWLTLGTSWVNHFWLMTDLSLVTGVKWLNMAVQRAKLFWSLGDHSYSFQNWRATGDAEVAGGDYDVLFWEDGKGKGVLMIFSKDAGTTPPRTVAAEPVVIEGPDPERQFPEYCRDENGVRRLRRISVKRQRLVLPAW